MGCKCCALLWRSTRLAHHSSSHTRQVSPPLYYFTSALPKLLHLSLIPAAFSFLLDRRSRRLLLPCLVYVGLLSALKHKEWRFVVYVVPAFTIAAAGGIVGLGALYVHCSLSSRNSFTQRANRFMTHKSQHGLSALAQTCTTRPRQRQPRLDRARFRRLFAKLPRPRSRHFPPLSPRFGVRDQTHHSDVGGAGARSCGDRGEDDGRFQLCVA